MMNGERTRWSRRYQAALGKHLQHGPDSSLRSALALGRQAVTVGMDTLDVARIHEIALSTMKSGAGRKTSIKRAEQFFAEAVTPIEKTHRAAVTARRRMKELASKLDRRTAGLDASRRILRQRIAQRKSAEEALEGSEKHHAKLIQESRRLQEDLRQLARQIILTQENERKKVSLELQDEIVQTLVGINVRLLTLRTGASSRAAGLKKEVASTQRLIKTSQRLMRRFARELGIHNET